MSNTPPQANYRLIIITSLFILLNLTSIPFLFNLVIDYSPLKCYLFFAHGVTTILFFVAIMLGFRRILNDVGQYHGNDIYISVCIWSTLIMWALLGLVWIAYLFDFVSGYKASVMAIIWLSVSFLLFPILSILMAVKLESCESSLYGLKNPIRLSFLWYGILSITFFLSELAVIATWFTDILLLLLFIKYKQQNSPLTNKSVLPVKRSTLWAGFSLTVLFAIGSFGSLFLLPKGDSSIFEYLSSNNVEESYPELGEFAEKNEKVILDLVRISGYNDVSYFNGDHIWLAADKKLVHSSDLGKSFQFFDSPLAHEIDYLQFDDSSTNGAIANNYGHLSLTLNGGLNWQQFDLYKLIGRERWARKPQLANLILMRT